MDRRIALLLPWLLLPGCFGSSDTATPPRAEQKTPVRVAQGKPAAPEAEQKEDPLANFDPSKFSLDSGDGDNPAMPKPETNDPEMKSDEVPQVEPGVAVAGGKLPPLVIAGAPTPPQPFSGKENEPGTQIPEEVQRTLNSYDEENFDAIVKLALTYPQAEVRAAACDKLDDIDDARGAEALLACRAALRDPNQQVRNSAANSIYWGVEQDGWKGEEALGELVTFITDSEAGYDALQTMQKLGPAAAPAVPYLTAVLEEEDANNRNEAVLTLGVIGEAAKPAVPKIVAFALESESGNAGRALGKLGAEKELMILLKNSNFGVRVVGYQGVVELENPREATVKLVLKGASNDAEWFERSSAAEALGLLRPSTPEMVDALARLATDEQAYVRDSAYEALGNLDPPSDRAIPILTKALQEEDEGRKYAVKQALSKCKGSPEVRLQSLLKLAADGDEDIYYTMGQGAKEFYPVLGKIALDPTQPIEIRAAALTAIPSMRNSLDRDWDEVNDEIEQVAAKFIAKDVPDQLRGAAGVVLNECGAERDDRDELLLLAVKTEGLPRTRKMAMNALGWREYEPALPSLIKIIKSQDERLLVAALESVSHFGEAAADAVPAIVGLKLDPQSDKYDEQASAQVRALGEIGFHPELSQPLIDKLLAETDKDDYLYQTILMAKAQVIAANDLDAAAILPPIVMILKGTKESYERGRAFQMLQTLGPKAASTTGLMITFLQAKDETDRSHAVETLETFGPAAKEAGPALVAAAGSWESPWAPLSALAEIQAGGPELAPVVEKLMQNIDNRSRVLETLAKIGPSAGAAAPAVVKVLDSPDEWERRNAIKALMGMQEAGEPGLAKLKEIALNDEEDYLRELASEALLKIAPDDPGVAEIVFSQLDVDDSEAVEKFMADLGDNASSFLTEKLKSDAPGVRKNALLLLSKANLREEEARKIYQSQLDSEDREVKGAAAHGLVKLGDRSPEVVAALVASLTGDGEDWLIHDDIYKLHREAKGRLIGVILDSEKSPEIRRDAVNLLEGSYDPSGDPGLKPLFDSLEGDDASQQMWSAITLARLGDRETPQVLKGLIVASKHADAAGEIAIQQLGQYSEADESLRSEAQDALVSLLQSDDEEVVKNAVRSLQYQQLKPEMIAKLVPLLSNEEARNGVIDILSNVREPFELDPAALQMLSARLTDEDEDVADSAAQVLAGSGSAGVDALIVGVAAEDAEPRPGLLLAISERDVNANRKLALSDASAKKLKELLGGDDQMFATAAAVVLTSADVQGVKVGPALLHGFDWEDYQFRQCAAKALQDRVSEANFLIPQLCERVRNAADEEKRLFFAEALAKLGKDSPEASDAIVGVLLANDFEYEQRRIANSLSEGARKKLIEKLGELESDEAKTRGLWSLFESARYRGGDGRQFDVPDMVREAVKSDNPEVAFPAALVLAELDPKSPDSVEPLLAGIEDDNDRWEAYEALRQLGAIAAPAVPRLQELLQDSEQRASALEVLASIGPAAAPATADITKLVAQEDWRYQAIDALKKIGPAAAEGAEALNAELRRTEDLTMLAQTLIAIQAPTDKLIAEYQRRLDDPYQKYDALGDLGAIEKITPIAPYLVKALASAEVEQQVEAANVITYLQQQDPAYLEPLLKMLDSKNVRVVNAAISAASKQPNSADKMLPFLTKKLAENDEKHRYSVIVAIGAYGEAAKDLVPPLMKLISDKQIGDTVISTLGEIGPTAAAAVPQLQAELLDPSLLANNQGWEVTHRHWAAVAALGKIGPAAKPALPTLLAEYAAAKNKWSKEKLSAAIWKIDAAAAQQAGVEPPPKKEMED